MKKHSFWGGMMIRSIVITNVGKIRGNNEDNYYLNGKYKEDADILSGSHYSEDDRDMSIYAVCDGMGGEAYGEEAALIAVKQIDQTVRGDGEISIYECIEKANHKICQKSKREGGIKIGTTFTLLEINHDQANLYNIGDSRAYLYRNNELSQLSKDHTEAQRLHDMGAFTEGMAQKSRKRHILTQYLGIPTKEFVITPFVNKNIKLEHNDICLLCSDGLTDMLGDDEIMQRMHDGGDLITLANSLVDGAMEQGGTDNITVLLLQYVKEGQDKRGILQKLMRRQQGQT